MLDVYEFTLSVMLERDIWMQSYTLFKYVYGSSVYGRLSAKNQ
jgi:hypothetical protein